MAITTTSPHGAVTTDGHGHWRERNGTFDCGHRVCGLRVHADGQGGAGVAAVRAGRDGVLPPTSCAYDGKRHRAARDGLASAG